jgi:hypothetical protein
MVQFDKGYGFSPGKRLTSSFTTQIQSSGYRSSKKVSASIQITMVRAGEFRNRHNPCTTKAKSITPAMWWIFDSIDHAIIFCRGAT